MRIAVDVESVLANSNEAALQSTDKLNRREITNEWDLRGNTWQIYMGVSDAIWRHKPEIIPPEEPALDEYISDLREDHEVHILTAREHVDKQILWWLEEHNIGFDSFESTGRPKWEYDFDVWVDDNPDMVGHCNLLLRHQPHNTLMDVHKHQNCRRIYSLGEVREILEDAEWPA